MTGPSLAETQLQPGEWVTTGGGWRCRVRVSDTRWTERACDELLTSDDPVMRRRVGQPACVSTTRLHPACEHDEACPRCTVLAPGLGPMVRPPLGEVRRCPDTGVVAVAVSDDPLARAGSHGWRVVGEDPLYSVCFGWRGCWAVSGWERAGHVFHLAATAGLRVRVGGAGC